MKEITLILLMLSFILVSCDEEKDGRITNTIGLSPKELFFEEEGGTQTATTTKGDTWIIGPIKVNGEYVDTKEIQIANQNGERYYTFSSDCFQLERTHKGIILSLNENLSGQPRELEIVLNDRSYSIHLIIKQEKE